jgi:hypothetical protein
MGTGESAATAGQTAPVGPPRSPGEAPRSLGEALGTIRSVISYLADVDVADLPAEAQAEILIAMEEFDAGQAAVRGKAASVFSVQGRAMEYGLRSLRGWLTAYTKVTKGAAGAVVKECKLYEQHPVLVAALAELDVLTESWAMRIAAWTNVLPGEHVRPADEILVQACRAGADLRLLSELAAQIRIRLCGPDPEEEKDKLIDRSVKLETTLGGAGVLTGGLTPRCAALLRAVLDALGQQQGKDDDRNREERDHDALQQACERLLGTSLVPEKNGRPWTAVVHVPFEHLLDLPGASVLEDAWAGQYAADWDRWEQARAAWAGKRAAETITGGDGGAWLDGDTARDIVCDALIMPVVTATPDPSGMSTLVDLCIDLRHLEDQQAAAHAADADGPDTADGQDADGPADGPGADVARQDADGQDAVPEQAGDGPDAGSGQDAAEQTADVQAEQAGPEAEQAGPEAEQAGPEEQAAGEQTAGRAGAQQRRERVTEQAGREQVGDPADGLAGQILDLRRRVIGAAVDIVSGPDGLASLLRRALLGIDSADQNSAGPLAGVLGGKSMPLDVGVTRYIPPHIRRAVEIRGPVCEIPGCDQPAYQSEPHHICPLSQQGATKVTNLLTTCWWHHHDLIHRRGWHAALNGDGTVTLRKPDGTILLTGPPPRPG